MNVIGNVLTGFVGVLHLYFLTLEMFLWTRPLGLKVFRQSLDQAKASAVLAANQGLYNGFLSAGLIWGLLESDATFSKEIKIFFLSCVAIAGVYGGLTVNKRIFFIQALPAIIAMVLFLVK